ncbi:MULTISPECIES: three component ABC system middle component [Ralstonia]|uniref:three component ABC system middle component n=1 Tax=Ralstonia TaxID=48736 RepID=UPI000C7D5975|nr:MULTISPECIES: three component ABC system middle component [Ralstonia]PLT18961.1 hypothetical protein CXP34_02935 [Ralstonia mannitolilytica]
MMNWDSRPFEIRNLFNPAFCAVVLAAAIRAYQKQAGAPMPYSLTLLILPLALHHRTCNEIALSPKISILRIIARQPDLLVDFAPRARGLIQPAMEAFALLARHNCIEVTDAGSISLGPKKVSMRKLATPDAERCRSTAATIGRQFAQINDRVTIYTSLGIRP